MRTTESTPRTPSETLEAQVEMVERSARKALARLTERNRVLEAALMEFRDVLVDLPRDALGEGRGVEAHWITGDAEEVRWPIRDEMIGKITRALTDTEAPHDR